MRYAWDGTMKSTIPVRMVIEINRNGYVAGELTYTRTGSGKPILLLGEVIEDTPLHLNLSEFQPDGTVSGDISITVSGNGQAAGTWSGGQKEFSLKLDKCRTVGFDGFDSKFIEAAPADFGASYEWDRTTDPNRPATGWAGFTFDRDKVKYDFSVCMPNFAMADGEAVMTNPLTVKGEGFSYEVTFYRQFITVKTIEQEFGVFGLGATLAGIYAKTGKADVGSFYSRAYIDGRNGGDIDESMYLPDEDNRMFIENFAWNNPQDASEDIDQDEFSALTFARIQGVYVNDTQDIDCKYRFFADGTLETGYDYSDSFSCSARRADDGDWIDLSDGRSFRFEITPAGLNLEDGYLLQLIKIDGNDPSYSGLWPFCSSRLLTEKFLEPFDSQTLKKMRNEVFARHSYSFSNPELKAYFLDQPWYLVYANSSNDDLGLNEVEEANVALLKKLESDPSRNVVMAAGRDFERLTYAEGDKLRCRVAVEGALTSGSKRIPVRLLLECRKDGLIAGEMTYTRTGSGKPVRVLGTWCDHQTPRGTIETYLTIKEYQPDGQISGTIEGQLLGDQIVRGRWGDTYDVVLDQKIAFPNGKGGWFARPSREELNGFSCSYYLSPEQEINISGRVEIAEGNGFWDYETKISHHLDGYNEATFKGKFDSFRIRTAGFNENLEVNVFKDFVYVRNLDRSNPYGWFKGFYVR